MQHYEISLDYLYRSTLLCCLTVRKHCPYQVFIHITFILKPSKIKVLKAENYYVVIVNKTLQFSKPHFSCLEK